MVGPRDIGQIIAEILGAAGRTARQSATAPLMDLERRNAGPVQCCGVVDALYLMPPVPCIIMTAGILSLAPAGN